MKGLIAMKNSSEKLLSQPQNTKKKTPKIRKKRSFNKKTCSLEKIVKVPKVRTKRVIMKDKKPLLRLRKIKTVSA